MTYKVELTDTFGGEANYSWVKRASVSGGADYYGDTWTRAKEQRIVMRRAKKAVGLSGVRGTTERVGDGYYFRPYRICQIMFVIWQD